MMAGIDKWTHIKVVSGPSGNKKKTQNKMYDRVALKEQRGVKRLDDLIMSIYKPKGKK